MPPQLPTLIVTGATGFIGRYVVAALQRRFRIHAFGRRSPGEARAPEGDGITWYQVDIDDKSTLESCFRAIAAEGGATYVLHLAAFYDFAGEDNPEYERTNVRGMRNLLEACRTEIKPRRFVFASSLAACEFPARGTVLTERSPVDGRHPYARSKRKGEWLMNEYRQHFPSIIVRLGAVYSDWCEFVPVFMFLGTWLSPSWRARVLGGQGAASLPFVHVREVVSFLARLFEREGELGALEVLIASPDEATSHRQLFSAATECFYGHELQPILMPAPLARLGMQASDIAGRVLGNRPFERPWMADYIDLAMPVDASFTRSRLGWAPSPRFAILRRMPFIVENFKTQPLEWNRRNLAALKAVRLANHLRIFQLIESHQDELVQKAVERARSAERRERMPTYQKLSAEELNWGAQQTYLHLKHAVRTRERGLFKTYCADIAERRFRQGFAVDEVVAIIELEHETCLRVLLDDPRVGGLEVALHDTVNMAFRLGADQVQDTFDQLTGHFVPVEPPG